MTRILLAYPGGEVKLFEYKKPVPIEQSTRKMASIASDIFPSWYWGDGDIPAIDGDQAMILLVGGPTGKECVL